MTDRRAVAGFAVALVLADLACLLTAALGAWLVRDSLSRLQHSIPLLPTAVMMATGLVVLLVSGLYAPVNLVDGTKEFQLVVRACVVALAADSAMSFLLQSSVSREWLVLAWLMAAPALLLERFLMRRISWAVRRRSRLVRRALLVGVDADAAALAAALNDESAGMKVVGFLDDYHPVGTLLSRDLRVLGGTAALQEAARREAADDAIIVPQALPWETLQRLITTAAVAPDGPRVHISAGFYDLLTTSVRFSEHHHIPLLTVNKARLSLKESIVKTSLDYAIAAALLIALSPLIALVATWQAVRGRSGPFQRRRVAGVVRPPFDMLTFRSSEPFHSTFILKLPALLNVLAGQLSIVGPRPRDIGEVAPPGVVMARLRPGLTGPWREVEDPAEQSLLDLYYIRAYSISLDLQVMLRRLRSRLRIARGSVAAQLAAEQGP